MSSAVIERVLNGLMEGMEPRDREMFCRAIDKSSDNLRLQLRDFVEMEWYSAAKRRSDCLRHLEKIKCGNELVKD
jgi:hypothetical protein